MIKQLGVLESNSVWLVKQLQVMPFLYIMVNTSSSIHNVES